MPRPQQLLLDGSIAKRSTQPRDSARAPTDSSRCSKSSPRRTINTPSTRSSAEVATRSCPLTNTPTWKSRTNRKSFETFSRASQASYDNREQDYHRAFYAKKWGFEDIVRERKHLRRATQIKLPHNNFSFFLNFGRHASLVKRKKPHKQNTHLSATARSNNQTNDAQRCDETFPVVVLRARAVLILPLGAFGEAAETRTTITL